MSKKLIRAAFESRLNAWASAQVPRLPVAWQNVNFTPPSGPYLQAFILPAATTSEDLKGAHRSYKGIFQVTLVHPSGQGSGAAETITQEIADLFPVNLRLPAGNGEVMVLSPMSEGPIITDTSEFSIPVSCRYRMDAI